MEAAEDFRANLNDYAREYDFLAQIVPCRDPSWSGCISTAATSSIASLAVRAVVST